MSTTSINLLGTTTRVEVPVIGIKIGKYTLGVYSRKIGISDYYDIKVLDIDNMSCSVRTIDEISPPYINDSLRRLK